MNVRSSLLAATLLFALGAIGAVAQNNVATAKKVVVNPDGSYTVIEYPVGKEVVLDLTPTGTITGKGVVHVTRSANGTHLVFNMTGLPADVSSYYAYAVDPTGAATLLGPITFNNGIAMADFTTPMNQFMVVLSPDQ